MFFVVVIFALLSFEPDTFILQQNQIIMKPKLLLILFILFSSYGYSQMYEISGTVLDATSGMPLPSVNIVIKNTTKSITSDIAGNFNFSNIPSGSKLVFSFIGYTNYEVNVTKNDKITVSLKESQN